MKRTLPLIIAILAWSGSLLGQTVSTLDIDLPVDDGITIDAAGNIYASHFQGSTVTRIAADGTATVYADGFESPNGLAFDSQGNLFICDYEGNRIYKVTPDGTQTVFVDNITNPSGMIRSFDSDTLIVSLPSSNSIIKLDPEGNYEVIAAANGINAPVGLAYDDEGRLYAGNFSNRRVYRIESDGTPTLIANLPGSQWLGFICFFQGQIYGTDFNGHRIYRTTLDGEIELYTGGPLGSTDGELSEARFNSPNGIWPSQTGDSLLITEYGSENMRIITDFSVTSWTNVAPARSWSFSLSPNPIRDDSQLQLDLATTGEVSFRLIDIAGRLLQQQQLGWLPAGEHQIPFTLDTNYRGLVNLEVRFKDQAYAQQFVILD